MPKSKTRRKGAVRPAKLSPVLALVICLIAAFLALRDPGSQAALPVSMDDIPAYSGEAYIEINGGEPFFIIPHPEGGCAFPGTPRYAVSEHLLSEHRIS